MTSAFGWAEAALSVALISLAFWLAPQPESFQWSNFFGDTGGTFVALATSLAYAFVVLFLEPFYVAAGFAMYLNRRAELEAWDIEQEFRRAFAH